MKKVVFGLFLAVMGVVAWRSLPNPVVVEVVDGDTIKLADGRRVRYIGIDTPEEGECFREESIKMNEELVLGKKVKLKFDQDTMDDYGRLLAYVYLDGVMVNEELLEEGAGEYFYDKETTRFGDQLMAVAEKAHEEKKGKWGVCGGEEGCLIKGNIDRLDKRWYHLAGFRHYEQTEVNLDHGDRWFCSEAEAMEAGFERARE